MAALFLIDWAIEADEPVSIFEDAFNGACGFTDLQLFALTHFLAWPDEASPQGLLCLFEPDDFYFAVVGEETGAHDAGIVEHDEVVVLNVAWEVLKLPMLDRAGVAMNDHHARRVPAFERPRGYEFLGQFVVKVRGFPVGFWHVRI